MGSSEVISIHGMVLVQAPRLPQINYGDRIRVSGNLREPPFVGSFDYAEYLARQGVYSLLGADSASLITNDQPSGWLQLQFFFLKPVFEFKQNALAAIARTFPEPQGSLLSGILLGVDTNVPESLQDAFRVTGTSHILAISGFNISIIAGLFSKLFRRFLKERWAILATIISISIYTLLAGASASVVRAALMGSIVLIAGGFNRPSNGLASLSAAAFLMTLFSPSTVYDVGFQLSAAATLGIILYAEPFSQAAVNFVTRFVSQEAAKRVIDAVKEFFIITIAAQITTLPLIAFYFHQVSLISLLANFIVLPAQPAVMVLGGIATLGAMVNTSLGYLLSWLAWPFVTYTILVVEALAKVPFANIVLGQFPVWALFGCYLLLFGLTWLQSQEPHQRPKWITSTAVWVKSVSLTGLAIATLGLWTVALQQPDRRLHVTFLDVGQGDAILIQTPTGRYALIDGGPSPNRLAEALGRNMPLTVRTIDWVISASPRADSLSGLTGLLGRYEIGQVLMAGDAPNNAAYREWMEGLEARDISPIPAQAGQRFILGGDAFMEVVAVEAKGSTLRITYGGASFLLPITSEFSSEQAMSATVLLAPQYGDDESLARPMLTMIQPSTVIISAGNSKDEPSPAMLELLKPYQVLQTHEHGTIEFVTDGRQLWVRTEE
jgi:competence protein ComEC